MGGLNRRMWLARALPLAWMLAALIVAPPARAATGSYVFIGRVTAVSPSQLRIAQGRTSGKVGVGPSTRYVLVSYGSQHRATFRTGTISNIHVGQTVLLTLRVSGRSVVATQVEDLPKSPYLHVMGGRIQSISSSRVVLVQNGKSVSLSIGPETLFAVNYRVVPVSDVHPGDSAIVVGIGSANNLYAAGLGVARAIAARTTVQGKLHQDSASTVAITSAGGRTYQLRFGLHTRVTVNNKAASTAHITLFDGMQATVKGSLLGTTLVASSLSITTRVEVFTGRVLSLVPGRITLKVTSGKTISVQVPTGTRIVGSIGATHTVPVDSYVEVVGLSLSATSVRMIGGAIVHPVLRIDGTLASAAPIPTILSAHGDRYRLATSSSTRITVRQSNVRLALTDIPARAPLQVHGIVLTDGRLAVDQIAVSLPQATLQGRVDSNHGGTFTVRTSSRTVMVHVGGSTPVYQGKNSLARSDLVVGDHVTVSGYAGRVSIIANKILVHRSRVDTSGSVLGLTADGFRMQTSNGVRTVIIGSVAGNPTVTVPTLSVGAPVRVVGFVRGDGVILAWQVNLT